MTMPAEPNASAALPPQRVDPTFSDKPVYPVSNVPTPPRPANAPLLPPQAVFSADRSSGAGALATPPALERLAELLAHRGAEGPLVIAIAAGEGTGKSHALNTLGLQALRISQAANPQSPFLQGLMRVALNAPELAADTRDPSGTVLLAERLHGELTRLAPAFAEEAAHEADHATSDPHATARALSEGLDDARRRLDQERSARDDAETRRARLSETLLFETGGTRTDSYARANRGRIETALTAFGFTGGDPLATYKTLVHALSESGGTTGRWLASMRSLWGYRGQMRLIVLAAIFLGLGWGLGILRNDRAWLTSLRSGGDSVKSLADGFESHLSWFGVAQTTMQLLALFCLAALVWRAFRFAQPLMRGASLLDADVALRRTEIDRLVAHHTQRVETMSGTVDTIAKRASLAQQRLGGSVAAPAHPPAFVSQERSAPQAAQGYFAALDSLCAKSNGKGPRRILVTLDALDQVMPAQALTILDGLSRVLAFPNFVLAAAFDPARLKAVPDGAAALRRIVHVAYGLPAPADALGWQPLIGAMTGQTRAAELPVVDATQSALDLPLSEAEAQLLAALAPLAGPSVRGVKRLVNVYRLARHDAADELAALAFALALAIGGTEAEKHAIARTLDFGDARAPLALDTVSPRIATAIAAAATAQGDALTLGSMRKAQRVAALWARTL